MNSIGKNLNIYEDGKSKLQNAIQEYDQAILDATASLLAGKEASLMDTDMKVLFLSKD